MAASGATTPTSRSAKSGKTARTIRFPDELRQRVTADAERCGRSFEAQVLAILRSHFGEDVDLSPPPDVVLSLARASLNGVAASDRTALLRRLEEGVEE